MTKTFLIALTILSTLFLWHSVARADLPPHRDYVDNPPPTHWCHNPNKPTSGPGDTRDLKPNSQNGTAISVSTISGQATDGFGGYLGCADSVGTNGHGGPYPALGSGSNRYCHQNGYDAAGIYWTHAPIEWSLYYLTLQPPQQVPVTCFAWYQPYTHACNAAGWMPSGRYNAARLTTGHNAVRGLVGVNQDPQEYCYDLSYGINTCGTNTNDVSGTPGYRCCNDYSDSTGTWHHVRERNASGTLLNSCASFRVAIPN